MSDAGTIYNTSNVEITDKRLLHPGERLKRKFKKKNNGIKFLEKTPQQSRNSLKQKIKNRKNIQNVFSMIGDKDLRLLNKLQNANAIS